MNLLFDLDDTLYPEMQYIYQGFWAVAKYIQERYRLEAKSVYLELISIFKSGSKKVFDDFLNLKDVKEDPLNLVDIYRSTKRRLSLYPDVPKSLNLLRGMGNKLILVTNGRSETQREKIDALKISEYFDDIFILDDFGPEYWKPSTLIFDKIYNKYEGTLSDYIFVGNGEEDLEFSRRLGITFLLVNRKNNIRMAKIKDDSKTHIINDLREIKPYILSLKVVSE